MFPWEYKILEFWLSGEQEKIGSYNSSLYYYTIIIVSYDINILA